MQDNPFASIVNTIKSVASDTIPATLRIGTVSSEIPLTVDVGGALQDASALVLTSETATYRAGTKVLLIPIEEEQRYILLTRLVGL